MKMLTFDQPVTAAQLGQLASAPALNVVKIPEGDLPKAAARSLPFRIEAIRRGPGSVRQPGFATRGYRCNAAASKGIAERSVTTVSGTMRVCPTPPRQKLHTRKLAP